jgi:hypothetical protein
VQVYVPQLVDPPSTFLRSLRRGLFIALPIFVLLALLWVAYPAAVKARRRARRRKLARRAGPTARAALAYAEWREIAVDFGFRHEADTPLMFLTRFPADDEHRELAWLVTRCLWGDLMGTTTPAHARLAEELSRALRRRLAFAQPLTIRAVAAVSRLSLRSPYVRDDELADLGGFDADVPTAA